MRLAIALLAVSTAALSASAYSLLKYFQRNPDVTRREVLRLPAYGGRSSTGGIALGSFVECRSTAARQTPYGGQRLFASGFSRIVG